MRKREVTRPPVVLNFFQRKFQIINLTTNSTSFLIAYNDPIPRSINAPIFRPDSSYHGFSEV